MIRRRLPSAPNDLVAPGSAGVEETTRAIALLSAPGNESAPFTFTAYKRDAVKEALNATFGFKCAYCESYFGATQPLDVEHFRPKGGVEIEGKLAKPGYYWLAATWGNLLPSCTDCNRRRRQRLADGRLINSGKSNAFPIANEAKRARRRDDERHEERLLIHPVLDRPERHLQFEPDGLVRGTTRKGRTSVEVYALLRDGLVRARHALQTEIRTHLTILRGLARVLDKAGPTAELEALIAEERAALDRLMAPDRPYSALARQMIEPELEALTP